MARRRKPGPRTKSGRLIAAPDRGTPEAQAQRARILQPLSRRDLSMTDLIDLDPVGQSVREDPIGRLFDAGAISLPEALAARRYAQFYRGCLGSPNLGSLLGRLVPGGRPAGARHEEEESEERAAFRAARQVLAACGRSVARAVDNAAVFDLPAEPSRVKEGLAALARHFSSRSLR